MKILYIIPANIKDGEIVYSTFLKTEINGMINENNDVYVFHFIERNTLKGFYNSLKSLDERIYDFNPEVIHVHYGATTGLLGYLSKKKCPWVITFGGSELLGHPNKGLYWRVREFGAIWLSHFAAKKANQIICVSNNLLNKLSKTNQSKTTIIPRGIDLESFQILTKSESRQKLNWDPEKIYILFSMPRLNAEVKNIELAREVIADLKQSYSANMEMIILHNKSQEFLNYAMCGADVLLVTSFHEGSPNIVKESMACNLPIVSVNCGDVSNRLANVAPGEVVNNYDIGVLKPALIKVFDINIRSNGRVELLNQEIDLKSTLSKIVSVYKKTISSVNRI